jgi:hypothetical protein
MHITMAVVADAANRTDNGKLNLLGVFHTLYAVTTPCQHPHMAIVLNFEATAMERGTRQKIGIRLVNADGKPVINLPESFLDVPHDPTVVTPQLSLIANIAGVMFETFGAYQFDITVNDQIHGRIPIAIAQLPQSPVMPPPPPPSTL